MSALKFTVSHEVMSAPVNQHLFFILNSEFLLLSCTNMCKEHEHITLNIWARGMGKK